MKIGFIGTGNMGSALIKAFVDDKNSIFAFDPSAEKLAELNEKYGVVACKNNDEIVDKADIIILAVKPQIIDVILNEINGNVAENKIVISIAAGIKITKLEILGCKVIRIMPNTPCLISEMAGGISFNEKVNTEDKKAIIELFNKAGKLIEVKENEMDAVTGLSGSGPAFVARIIEGFIEAGENVGLSKEQSRELAIKTFIGSAKLLYDYSPEELINMVTSPNGTTAAGRTVLDNSNIKEIIQDTVKKATDRSRELGDD